MAVSAFAEFPRTVVILGATGSIGRQALEVIRADRSAFRVVGLVSAGGNPQLLQAQVEEFGPEQVGISAAGLDAASDVVRAARPDVVLNAIPGFAGLGPALAALEAPCLLAMAAKEAIVAAGHLLRDAARASGATLVPVDSEPCALAQCLQGMRHSSGDGGRGGGCGGGCDAVGPPVGLTRVYLTASGGPFWSRAGEPLEHVSPEEAVRHPRWAMGPKISVDSATLFNKGLEAIEISRLFGLPLEMIHIVVHPQSVVHAMAEFGDGSIVAQLGPTDMRVPISQALYYPRRAPRAPSRLSLAGLSLGFAEPEIEQWPCLHAALTAGDIGGTMPAAVSAADEVLVREFLAGRVSFGAIGRGLWALLGAHQAAAVAGGAEPPLEDIVKADRWARDWTAGWVASRAAGSEPAAGTSETGRPGEVS
jgi:1-deoxy-D-xylulose-5-phosphate reductoisomerase